MKYVGKLFGQIGRTRGYFDTGKTSGDWDALEARAERAEAELGKLQELHGCSQEMVLHWCEHAANRSLGLDQARAELAAEREKAERYRLATLKLDAELATERARLDSGTILLTVAGERVWHCGVDLRAAIDAAMKEDAK
jgi:hypothetical protein